VNIPEQEPQVGQADTSSWDIRFVGHILIRPNQSLHQSGRFCSSPIFPASIGPPDTKIVGIFSRMAAISIPGVILSQLLMQTRASALWAFTIYSMESAISSREGSEYNIPVVAHGDAVVHGDGIEFCCKTA